MGYLICNRCDLYCEIHAKEEIEELKTCECGNSLEYYDSLEEYLKEEEEIKKEPPDLLEQLINAYESLIAKISLYCVRELPFKVDIGKLSEILRGSRSAFILDHDLHRLPTFSVFSNLKKEDLEAMISHLISAGYLELKPNHKNPELKKLQITGRGESFISSGDCIQSFLMEEKIRKGIPLYDKVLYTQLRELRELLAKEKDIPLFQVCDHDTLLNLALEMPTDPNSMIKIKGIGRSFIENYGNSFLRLISEYKQK